MATITIQLRYESPNLLWRNGEGDDWQVMEPTSSTAETAAGDTVEWVLADDTIKKIKQIKVNKKEYIGDGHWKDIWSVKPKLDGDKFVGVVSTEMRKGDADGYEISVQIKNGDDVTVDPQVNVVTP